jgi:flagellar basal body-associated protein FliL
MARFCDKCGAHLNDSSSYCPACGAPVVSSTAAAASPDQEVPQPSAYTAPVQPYAPPVQGYVPPARAVQPAPAAKSGSALKIVLIVLVILVVCALGVVGSIVYLGHKVVTKLENKAAEAGLSTHGPGTTTPVFQGDPCRFLTKAEVSKAIGVAITGTRNDEAACEYLARGTAASMTSKHLSAIMGKSGADRATQDKIEKFAEGVFNTQQRNAEAADPGSAGETSVLSISFDQNSAQSQMKLDSKVLGALGPASGSSNLQGIGDEAFVAANGMMLVRKGDTLIRITYVSCPCSTEQIKPLAKKLAAAF